MIFKVILIRFEINIQLLRRLRESSSTDDISYSSSLRSSIKNSSIINSNSNNLINSNSISNSTSNLNINSTSKDILNNFNIIKNNNIN